jgi:hypothetical protein
VHDGTRLEVRGDGAIAGRGDFQNTQYRAPAPSRRWAAVGAIKMRLTSAVGCGVDADDDDSDFDDVIVPVTLFLCHLYRLIRPMTEVRTIGFPPTRSWAV